MLALQAGNDPKTLGILMHSKALTSNNPVCSFNRYVSVIYFEFVSVRFTSTVAWFLRSCFYDDFGLSLFYRCTILWFVHYSNPNRKLTEGYDHYEQYAPWAGFSSSISNLFSRIIMRLVFKQLWYCTLYFEVVRKRTSWDL